MKIKLCGVRTVADALLCANEGADEIGVIFAPTSRRRVTIAEAKAIRDALPARVPLVGAFLDARSEEHTSELQSRLHLVCRLLLEKKKTPCETNHHTSHRRPRLCTMI